MKVCLFGYMHFAYCAVWFANEIDDNERKRGVKFQVGLLIFWMVHFAGYDSLQLAMNFCISVLVFLSLWTFVGGFLAVHFEFSDVLDLWVEGGRRHGVVWIRKVFGRHSPCRESSTETIIFDHCFSRCACKS